MLFAVFAVISKSLENRNATCKKRTESTGKLGDGTLFGKIAHYGDFQEEIVGVIATLRCLSDI